MPAWRIEPGGIRLAVRLTPKASADRIDGIATLADGSEVVRVHVRAAPESGKANAALEKLVAETLGLPRSAVRVSAGATQRLKTLRIAGDPAEIAERLDILPGARR